MNRFQIILSTLLAVALVSCGKITDEQTLWELRSLPVVFSIITPMQTVQVSMSKSLVVGEKPDSVNYPEAKVFICAEDKKWIELTRQSSQKAIYKDLNQEIEIKEGETYFLRVDLPDNTITAQTTVPKQRSTIEDAKYVVDKDNPNDLTYLMGTLYAKINLLENDQCLVIANSFFVGDDNSTFVNKEDLTGRFSIPDSIHSFDVKLISLDPYFAKYWAAKKISILQNHYEGDLSIFIGTFNGLLPPYSNIKNGVGLFGSYVSNSRTVNITQP